MGRDGAMHEDAATMAKEPTPTKTSDGKRGGVGKMVQTWTVRIFLGLIIVSFAVWGIGDIFRGAAPSTVATVGDTTVHVNEFREALSRETQRITRQTGTALTAEQIRAAGLDLRVLGELISEAALDEEVTNLGLSISDADVVRAIHDEPAFKDVSGQFSAQRYDAVLANAGFTRASFEEQQRRFLARRQVADAIGGGLAVPRAFLEAVDRYQKETRTVSYFVVGPAAVGDIALPEEGALRSYFDERKASFRAPEYRKVDLLIATVPALSEKEVVTDEDVAKRYEERKSSLSTPEKRTVSRISFPNLDEAKAAADKIAAGSTFEAIAAERKLEAKDIELGTVAKSEIVDAKVAEAAFGLAEGATSGAVEGDFAAAIVKVSKIEPEVVKPLEEVRADLVAAIRNERARAKANELHDRIEDARAAGSTLAEIAAKEGLSIRSIEAIDRRGRDPSDAAIEGLPDTQKLLGEIFSSEVGAENNALQASEGGYVWFDLLAITPDRDRTFEEAKSRVETRWKEDELSKRLDEKAKAAVDRIAAGESFEAVAGELGTQVATLGDLTREAPSALFSRDGMSTVFAQPQDKPATTRALVPTDRVVFKVTSILVPPFDAESDAAKTLANQVATSMSTDIASQYVLRLQSSLGTSIYQRALDQAVGLPAS